MDIMECPLGTYPGASADALRRRLASPRHFLIRRPILCLYVWCAGLCACILLSLLGFSKQQPVRSALPIPSTLFIFRVEGAGFCLSDPVCAARLRRCNACMQTLRLSAYLVICLFAYFWPRPLLVGGIQAGGSHAACLARTSPPITLLGPHFPPSGTCSPTTSNHRQACAHTYSYSSHAQARQDQAPCLKTPATKKRLSSRLRCLRASWGAARR